MRGRNGWLTQGEGEGERVTDSNEAATSSQGGRGTCGLSVRYCGTRCGTEPSSSYCRFPVINVPRRASNPCTARSSPPLPLPLSLSLCVYVSVCLSLSHCSLPAHGISDRPWYRTTVLDIVDWYEKYLYRGNWDEVVKARVLGSRAFEIDGIRNVGVDLELIKLRGRDCDLDFWNWRSENRSLWDWK